MLYHKRGKRQRNSLQYLILETINKSSGALGNRIADDLLKVFGRSLSQSRKTNPRYDISRGVRRLIDTGYLQVKTKGGEEVFVLTSKGKNKLAQISQGEIQFKKPKKWDHKWRVIIYDIKEDRKFMRRRLSDALQHIGFVSVQKSVWAYPYPCEDLLAMIKGDFQAGKEVLYLVVDMLENDKWLKQHFQLKD